MDHKRSHNIESEHVNEEADEKWTQADTTDTIKLILFFVCLIFVPLGIGIAYHVTSQHFRYNPLSVK